MNAIALVTPPPNPNDTTPPTTPANLTGGSVGDGSTTAGNVSESAVMFLSLP